MNSYVEVFNEFSSQHNTKFNLTDILGFLDSKCLNGYFDRDVFQQLIDQIPGAEKTQQCTLNQLINVFNKAQDVLNDKINKCQQLIDSKNIEIRAYNDKLRSTSVSTSSKLNVEIVEAEVMYGGNGQLQVSIECMNQIVYTQLCRRLKPVWNESFEFNVNDEAMIKFTLLDTELQQKRGIGGIAFIDVNTFVDQMLHDIWVNVTEESSNGLRAKLHLRVQWIHSKNKYLQDLINENMINISQLEQEINDHVVDLDIINQPFKAAQKQNNLTISTYQTQPQPNVINDAQIDRLVQTSLLLIILYLVFGLLNSLYRTLFLDFLVIFYCFLFYKKNYRLQSLLHIKIIMVMLGIALLMDIIWLAIYSTPFLGEFNAHFDHLEFGLQKYQVILSWLLLFVKIIVLIFYIHIYASYPDKQTQVYDQQWTSIFGWRSKELNVYKNYI